MPPAGYDFTKADFPSLLLRRWFPERTDRESAVMRDFLLRHLDEFDAISFSVRVGQGLTANPEHLTGVQQSTVFSTRKKIDMLGWQGPTPVIMEVKQHVTPAVLGQLRTYRHLFLEEYPDAREPRLVAIGRSSDDDTLRVLASEGVDVYLFDEGPTE